MDELPVRRPEEQDEDAPLARDDSSWFAQQLGEEWRAEEPGIYRFVGPKSGSSNASASTQPRAITNPEAAPKPANMDAPRTESNILKRRAPASESDVLKTKRERETAFHKKRLAPAEGIALKEKLACAGQPEQGSNRKNGRAPKET